MKVLIISAAYPPMHVGEATNTYYLAKQLVDRKCDVHILTSQGNVGMDDEGITVHAIMSTWSWFGMARLRAFLKRCLPDAVLLMYQGTMYNYHPMITFASTLAKKVLPKAAFVTRFEHVFVSAAPAKTSFMSRVFRRLVVQWAGASGVAYNDGTLVRDSDRIIVLCELHHDVLMERSADARSKTVIIPPPPNMCICSDSRLRACRRGREKLGLSSDHFVMSFLGYLYAHKGIATLLEAFALVSRKRNNVRLVFIGGKYDVDVAVISAYVDQMDKLSKELGVDDKVIWTGAYTPDSDEASVYLYSSDVCVLPFVGGVHFNNSSFSSVVAHGLPIITTRGNHVDTPLKERENVLLIPPENPEALAAAMDSLIDDPELCERLGKGSLKLAHEWFSWDNATNRTLEALTK